MTKTLALHLIPKGKARKHIEPMSKTEFLMQYATEKTVADKSRKMKHKKKERCIKIRKTEKELFDDIRKKIKFMNKIENIKQYTRAKIRNTFKWHDSKIQISSTADIFKKLYPVEYSSNPLQIPLAKIQNIQTTTHAEYRFIERFESHGYTMEQIINDIKKNKKNIRVVHQGRLRISTSIGTYIVDRETNFIITMYLKWYRW